MRKQINSYMKPDTDTTIHAKKIYLERHKGTEIRNNLTKQIIFT